MEILAEGNLFGFFYDRVHGTARQRGAELDEHTEFYLVNLLVDFLNTPQLIESGGQRVDGRPLALRLLDSVIGDPRGRVRELKHLADSTLVKLGFFTGSLERRSSVGRAYYEQVGTSAYQHLAVLTGTGFGAKSEPVFSELGARFHECVEILEDVREESQPSDAAIVATYERWLATGDARTARRLRALGVAVPGGDGGGTLH